jgi:hypothetical protein
MGRETWGGRHTAGDIRRETYCGRRAAGDVLRETWGGLAAVGRSLRRLARTPVRALHRFGRCTGFRPLAHPLPGEWTRSAIWQRFPCTCPGGCRRVDRNRCLMTITVQSPTGGCASGRKPGWAGSAPGCVGSAPGCVGPPPGCVGPAPGCVGPQPGCVGPQPRCPAATAASVCRRTPSPAQYGATATVSGHRQGVRPIAEAQYPQALPVTLHQGTPPPRDNPGGRFRARASIVGWRRHPPATISSVARGRGGRGGGRRET